MAQLNFKFIKFVYEKQGGHYAASVFTSGSREGTFAKIGEVVIDEKDFEALDSGCFEIILQEKRFPKAESDDPGTIRNIAEDMEFADKYTE